MIEDPTESRACTVKGCDRVVGPYYSAQAAEAAMHQHVAFGHLKKARPSPGSTTIPDWAREWVKGQGTAQ